MVYDKSITLYESVPFDDVNVAADLFVLRDVLEASQSLSYGLGGEVATEAARINFDPTQSVIFLTIDPSRLDFKRINYMRVTLRNNFSTEEEVFYYFVDRVDTVDAENPSTLTSYVYKFTIRLDVWATHALTRQAEFYGGVLIRAGAITDYLNVNGDEWDARAGIPFDPSKLAIEEADIYPAFNTFRAVVQITGKDLEKAVLLVSQTNKTAREALADAQAFTVSRKIQKKMQGAGVLAEFEEGEYKVQGAYIVPSDFLPLEAFDNVEENDPIWGVYPKGAGTIPDRFFVEVVGSGENYPGGKRRFRLGLGEMASRLGYNYLEIDANAAKPYPFARRVTVGTLYNRFDLSEYVCRGSGLPYLDTVIETVFGLNSFNITIATGASGAFKDITDDFKVYSLVDPESEYIRANKANAVLSGIGSISQIATGAVTAKASPAAGVSLIAGGVSGLLGTITNFQTATTAPNVIQGSGYGDATAYLGGIFYSVSSSSNSQWEKAIKNEGIGRKLQISGRWFLDLGDEDLSVNPLAVAGVNVRGVPKEAGDKIAQILANGVRLWYSAAALADMEY